MIMPHTDEPRQPRRFPLRRFLLSAGTIALALWLGSSAIVAWKFTRRASPQFQEPPPKVAWGTIEGHRLSTSDGQQIGAWLVRGDPKQGCILLLHGNRASRCQMLSVMELTAKKHCTVLAISLRAHGDSTGETNDIGWSARHDVIAAVEFLEREFPGRPILVIGRSLGAAAAVFAAKDLNNRVAGYFFEQPYKDLDSAVWHRLQHSLPPVFDYAAYAGLRLWAPAFLSTDPDEISLYKHIEDVPRNVPIVFITGSADRHAPLADVVAIFERVRSHANLVVVEGATHEALDCKNPQLYQKTLFKLRNMSLDDYRATASH
jgi:uncharacterized protein